MSGGSYSAEPVVIKCKVAFSKEDFEKWAEDIKKQAENIIVIPYDAEVVLTNISTDLISRADAIEAVEMAIVNNESIHKTLLALPSADRPKGKWVSNHSGYWKCSECGIRVAIYGKGNFCPNCGADMRKKDGDSE